MPKLNPILGNKKSWSAGPAFLKKKAVLWKKGDWQLQEGSHVRCIKNQTLKYFFNPLSLTQF